MRKSPYFQMTSWMSSNKLIIADRLAVGLANEVATMPLANGKSIAYCTHSVLVNLECRRLLAQGVIYTE